MCPSDANGVYSLPTGYTAITGEVIQASQHNPPLEDLESAMSARLMRSGVAPMTGPLKIVDGSVGSPGFKFSSDGTTGVYKTTNGIGVSVGGTKVAEFTANSISRMIGELIPWTRLTAPDGWVFPYGQTLSRTTYADLWGIAQTEIASGNTFYNNGDGSTTFGIGDMRGRVIAGKDDMGGSSAGRLTPPISGGVSSGTTLGGAGGTQGTTLVTANLPAYTPSGSISNGAITISQNANVRSDLNVAGGSGSNVAAGGSATITASQAASSFTGSAQGGTSTAFNNVQPTLICDYILYAGA